MYVSHPVCCIKESTRLLPSAAQKLTDMVKITFLFFLAAGVMAVQGSDVDKHSEEVPQKNPAVHRPKRWSGFSLFHGSSSVSKPTTKPTAGGFLKADLQTSKPAGGNDFGFKLEDALRPAVKPTDQPGGDCSASVVQKLNQVIANQNQELRLLLQLVGSP